MRGDDPRLSQEISNERNTKMSYKIVAEYTPEVEDKDYVVFCKTNFQTPVLNARGKVVRWTQDADNYVYALFPNRRMHGSELIAESYVKPHGEILSWKDKLRPVDTMELDAMTVDLPATWEEVSDLLTKLVVDHTVSDGCVVIEDATTWQKLRVARRKLLRARMDEVLNAECGNKEDADTPICDPYPLAISE